MPSSGSTFFRRPTCKEGLLCAFETLEAFDNEGPILSQSGIQSDGAFHWTPDYLNNIIIPTRTHSGSTAGRDYKPYAFSIAQY
jgi:hypothetical protein